MNYIVSVPIGRKVAEFIGKRSEAESSIAFYNRKMDDNVIVALAPSDVETKFYGMAEALLISKQIIISTENMDRALGEGIVAASLLNKHVIITDDNDIKSILAGTTLNDYELSTREELLEKITKYKNPHEGEPLRVDIDSAFNVKGIGTVALGIVISGSVKVHDDVYHTSGKKVNIKSIQSQDVNIERAGPDTRVGLALKGIEADEFDKGDIIASKVFPRIMQVKAKLKQSSFIRENLGTPKRYGFACNFSYAEAHVGIEGDMATISFERPIPVAKGDEFLLLRSNMPRIFASGVIEEVTPWKI